MLGLKRGTVLLAPHETGWETYAAETMKRLRAVLGDAAVEMQHVGSTAVPTIQAKPIVDLAVAVRQLSDVEPLFPALEAQGFYHAAHCDNEGTDSAGLRRSGSGYPNLPHPRGTGGKHGVAQ